MGKAEYQRSTSANVSGRWSFLAIACGLTWTVVALGVLAGITNKTLPCHIQSNTASCAASGSDDHQLIVDAPFVTRGMITRT